jgi:hypothetical protein
VARHWARPRESAEFPTSVKGVGSSSLPTKKESRCTSQGTQLPLALSGLQKNGSRWPVPACTFAPHASGTPSSDWEDSKLYLTIFILWGVERVCMALLVTWGDELAEAPCRWSGIEG